MLFIHDIIFQITFIFRQKIDIYFIFRKKDLLNENNIFLFYTLIIKNVFG